MDKIADFDLSLQELVTGINLTKCQQCGCMSETLEQIGKSLLILPEEQVREFRVGMAGWVEKMKAVRYSCLGCEHCYAGVAQNAFTTAFPQVENQFGLSCEILFNSVAWPPVVGEYFVTDANAQVAVTTLASTKLAKTLAEQKIPGIAIVGKLETENIGIDKIIKNTIANPNIRSLIVCGAESQGHLCGQTLLALSENGVDETGRVIGSKGKRPILRNVTQLEVNAFRRQIKMIDLIGCECVECIQDKLAEIQTLAVDLVPLAPCSCTDGSCQVAVQDIGSLPAVFVEEPELSVKLDKAGYFVILPIQERKVIHVEHYSYDNSLLHVIEGISPRNLYLQIIEKNWVTEMSHAAYLGKELAKAELSLSLGIPYNQDAA
jgi:tetrahydromethanopterin S-methyltransferase subunit A